MATVNEKTVGIYRLKTKDGSAYSVGFSRVQADGSQLTIVCHYATQGEADAAWASLKAAPDVWHAPKVKVVRVPPASVPDKVPVPPPVA